MYGEIRVGAWTRNIGPLAPGCGLGIARGRTTKLSAAAASAAVPAGPRRPARRSPSAAHGAAAATCGVNDSNGTATVSARRIRSTAVVLATAHAARPPATAQEILVTFDPTPATITAYDLRPAEAADGGAGGCHRSPGTRCPRYDYESFFAVKSF